MATLAHFPAKLRTFLRGTHDALVLHDVRDLASLGGHQAGHLQRNDRVRVQPARRGSLRDVPAQDPDRGDGESLDEELALPREPGGARLGRA